jgi:hypothetical protein
MLVIPKHYSQVASVDTSPNLPIDPLIVSQPFMRSPSGPGFGHLGDLASPIQYTELIFHPLCSQHIRFAITIMRADTLYTLFSVLATMGASVSALPQDNARERSPAGGASGPGKPLTSIHT